MSRTSQPDDSALREQLVAYLDGELAHEDESAIEARIASDDVCRSEMQGLERAWNALDVLPRATVDDGFTRTTIEMIAMEAQREVAEQTAMMPARRRSRWFAWTAAAAAALLIGMVASRVIAPDPNRELYAELPLIAELDAYNQSLDVEFLKGLITALPNELGESVDTQIASRASTLARLSTAGHRERVQYVAALGDDERYDLAGKENRFSALSPQRQDSLRELHQTIASSPDSATLWQAMLVYSDWASDLPAADQATLRSEPTDARLRSVAEWNRRMGRQRAFELSPENARALRDGFQQVLNDPEMETRYRALVGKLTEPQQKKLADGEKRNNGLARTIAVLFFARMNNQQTTPEFTSYYQGVENKMIGSLDADTQRRLRSESVEARFGWLMQGMREAYAVVDDDELAGYFASDKVSNAERQRLLAMPTEHMRRRLRDMYFDATYGEDRPGGWWPRSWGDDDDRRPRDGRFGPGGPRGFGPSNGRDGRDGPPGSEGGPRPRPPGEGFGEGPPPPGEGGPRRGPPPNFQGGP